MSTESDNAPRLRLWPILLLAALHLVVLGYTLRTAHTLFQFLIGTVLIPFFVLLGLVAWWMLSKSIPIKERLAGITLLVVALAWIILTHPIATGGFTFLMIVFPILTIGTAIVATLTARLPWPRRRAALAALLIGTPLLLTAVRVEGTHGDETPILAWRWQPTPDERLEAGLLESEELQGIAAVPATTAPGDWPAFRGALRDSRAAGAFDTAWAQNAPRELWRRPIGLGWSSFAAVGDYLFTQEQRGAEELVVCYEAATGAQVWTNKVPARFDESHGSGPRATPTFHEGALYTYGATGILQRLSAQTGETVWKRDIAEDAGIAIPTWGFSSSPLVVDGLVVVFAGGGEGKSVFAYHQESGKRAWHGGDATHSYSSLHLARIQDVPQLLIPSNLGIQSLALNSGEVLWQFEKTTPIDDPTCIQPLLPEPGIVLVGSEVEGMRRLELAHVDGEWEVEEQWLARKFRPSYNDLVHHEGFAYGFDGRLLVCVDIATGERRWKSQRFGGQILLLPDMAMLLVSTDKGEVVLLEATPEAPREVARLQAIEGKTWNHPVVAHGRLYIRNAEEAIAYDLPGWGAR